MQETENLYTLREIARLRGLPYYVVRYALAAHEVPPMKRAGVVRVWGEHQLPEIYAAIDRTAKSREAVACG